jgi:lysophospholipase L1-like esterase
MLKNQRFLIKILLISVTINTVGFFFADIYIYKKRLHILKWLSTLVRIAPNLYTSPPMPLGKYGLKTNEFNMLRENLNGKKTIIFAGDSLMADLEWNEHFAIPDDIAILKRVIGGETIDRFIDRVEVTVPNPHNIMKIFIMIGINDIKRANFQIDAFSEKYHTLLEKLLALIPADKICIHSILPTRRETISNLLIKKVNQNLKPYADEKGVCYIDLYDKLTDLTGLLDVKYTYDGIHLSLEGYKIWLGALQPHIFSMMQQAKHPEPVLLRQ